MNVNIIPTPKKATFFEGKYALCAVAATVYVNAKYANAALAFSEHCRRAGIDLNVTLREPGIVPEEGIVIDTETKPEFEDGYSLKIVDGAVRIAARDAKNIARAFATLAQLLCAREQNAPGKLLLPGCEIHDRPDRAYRGLLVDLARFFHPFEFLKAYVDACWYYKLSTLQLHFTDDQSYTLPSRIYPKLSTPGRHYTFEQIEELCAYAAARGVELMPEIDVPGHNTSFANAYPELFGTKGIICRHEDATEALQNVFSELCDLFPDSHNIHIGGDEANLKKWLECPECMEYARGLGITREKYSDDEICDRLYVDFILRMCDAVKAKGRQPIVWEGFPKYMNALVPKDVIVMSWENYYQITPDLLEAGFNIINCSWNPMYIVAPDVKWTPEEVCSWSIYKWRPVHPGSPFAGGSYECAPTDKVLGGQLLAWGDRVASIFGEDLVKGAFCEFGLILERLPYLAQNTWNVQSVLVYNELAGPVKKAEEGLEKLFSGSIKEGLAGLSQA